MIYDDDYDMFIKGWQKPENSGKNHLTICNQYMAFLHWQFGICMFPLSFWTAQSDLIDDDVDLGYLNGRILPILNLHVATMPPTKFQLNPTYGSGGDVKKVKS